MVAERNRVMDFGEPGPRADGGEQWTHPISFKRSPCTFGLGTASHKEEYADEERTPDRASAAPGHPEQVLHYPRLELVLKVLGNLI